MEKYIKRFVIFALAFLCIISYGCKPRAGIPNKNIVTEENNYINNDNQTSRSIIEDDSENIIIEISDLNGTWLPDWYYRAGIGYQMKEEDFSWGKGQTAVYSSFDIDVTSDIPFINPPEIRPFSIKEIMQTGKNSIILHVGDLDEDDWFLKITFRFVNKDALLIEAKDFYLTFREGDQTVNPYGGAEIWRRLSGPLTVETEENYE